VGLELLIGAAVVAPRDLCCVFHAENHGDEGVAGLQVQRCGVVAGGRVLGGDGVGGGGSDLALAGDLLPLVKPLEMLLRTPMP